MVERADRAAALNAGERTVRGILDRATAHLAERGFDEPRLHVETLLAHVLGIPRLMLLTNTRRQLSHAERERFLEILERRCAHEPLQYIVGETEFMGCPLFVDRSVLIPRPETELLVEKSVEVLGKDGAKSVLDIGTGSGNIAIALARFAPRASITAIDVSPDALEVAARNIARNGVDMIRLLRKDIFAMSGSPERFDVIVANPPYVPAEEFLALAPEIRDFEPAIATTDGGDGLRYIRGISAYAGDHLNPGGWILMEIGWGQADAAREALRPACAHEPELFEDFAGIPRVIRGQRSEA